jgi:hypothetical protein
MGKTSHVSRVFLCDPFDWAGDQNVINKYQQFLEEIDDLKLIPSLMGSTGPQVRVRLREQNYMDVVFLSRHGMLPVKAYEDLVPIVVEADWPLDSGPSHQMARAAAMSLFESYAVKIIVAMSMYFPGSVRCHYAYSGGFRGHDLNMACGSELQECIPILIKHKIRITPSISFIDFLEWLSGIDGFWAGRPKTNLERAICLLTHMHHYTFLPDNIDDFVWCMAAVEAMYTSTASSIAEQLKRRIKIFLPDYQGAFSTRTLNNLYGYRSRLIHGDIPVRNRFIEADFEEYEDDRYGESFAVAVAIAIKTVHRAAELKLTEVSFKEVLDS